MDWDKLRIFHAVADAGSLTHAGDKLNLSQSAVSRQIRGLEEQLNTNLFHRHARGLILTEQGELLFDATVAMSKRLDTAAARIRDSEEEVFGELRVTTTTGFGTLWLAPRLPKLYEKYPDLKVDLMLEERVLDLPMREADVAIRMKEPSQADLVRKKLMMIKMCMYASPAYLAANGTPQRLEDMSKTSPTSCRCSPRPSRRMCPYSLPTLKSCVLPNASRHSRILSKTRSSPTANCCARRNPASYAKTA